MSPAAGITYRLGRTLYIALTNSCNAVSLIQSRGPGFVMPAESGFEPLRSSPTAEEIAEAADASKVIADFDSIAFAGAGEPLLRMRVLEGACGLLQSHGVPMRLVTNGLVAGSAATATAQKLHAMGLSRISVALQTADAEQYMTLMRPEKLRYSPVFSHQLSHDDVTGFVQACVAVGLEVECTAVAAPSVDLQAAEELASALGAASFRSRKYFDE